MNNILRITNRLSTFKTLMHPIKQVAIGKNLNQQRQLARNLWYMCRIQNHQDVVTPSHMCGCGCGKMGTHSKAEKELVEFLTEEILAERKSQKMKTIPTELGGFKAELNGAEVSLTKALKDETVKITFNVNHTVDTEAEPEIHENQNEPELGDLRSKPSFKVEIIRGDTTVNLLCSFVTPNEQDEAYNDIFGIDEISIYEGDWNENVYAVSGEIVDSYLYDLILNYLEEKGISNDFVKKLSEYSTAFEHSAYIGLLEGLSKFASGK